MDDMTIGVMLFFADTCDLDFLSPEGALVLVLEN